MKRIALTILSVLLLFHFGNSQTLRFHVMKGNKSLGEMTVKRAESGNVEEIHIKSEVTYRILFSFTVEYTMYEKFRNGRLDWGKAISTLNGNVQKESKIIKTSAGHDLTLNGSTAPVTESIDYSISQVYFYEPKDGQRVFSQQFSQFLSFKKVGENEYLLSSPDGDNYYKYVNGICVNVRVLRDFANFDFVMQPETLKAVRSKADSLYVEAH